MSTNEARGSFTPGELPAVAWRTSSRSVNSSGNCVEAGPVGDGSGRVGVRHSRHPQDRTIVYAWPEWDTFIAGIKHGDFDFT